MLNKVELIGNLGRDPEVKYMPSGDAVASFSIACTESWKDKNGEKQERTEWVRISAFRRLAEICGEYLKKGSQVYIEGKLHTSEFEKDGVKRYSTEVIADEMKMLGGKRDASGPSEQRSSAPAKPSTFDDLEDDIPF